MQKDYQKEDLTVHWKQDVCAHAGECVRNLNKVFDPEKLYLWWSIKFRNIVVLTGVLP